MDKELLQEYHERNKRWGDKSLSQLSFFNNLILTLGVGFLSIGYQDLNNQTFIFSIDNIDWKLTTSLSSIIFVSLSIFVGLLVGINRLWDFRLTRQINQIRQRMYEHSEVKLDQRTPNKYSLKNRLFLYYRLFREKFPRITIEQCREYNDLSEDEKQKIKSDFRELRKIVHNLGLNTWSNTRYQVVTFSLGILLFVIGKVI